jgi:6-phosphogluconolactonase
MPPSVSARLFLTVGHGNPRGDIQILRFDPSAPAADQLSPHGLVSAGSSTSYIAFHPNGRLAYTTQNRADRVTAWAVDAQAGTLQRLGDAPVPATPGAASAGPAYVSVDRRGRFVLVANYRGHNVVVFALGDDGGMGAQMASVSSGQHAHCVVLSPDNQIAFSPYLGSDLVAQYRFGGQGGNPGQLTPHDPPAVLTAPGAGPRHLIFSPNGQFAYLLNELDATLYGYRCDPQRGLLECWRVATLPADYDGQRWSADLHVHPDGRTLYVSNRAHDSLTVFALDPGGGPPTAVQWVSCGGKSPRNFCVEPAGHFLFVANQDSANLVTFAIEASSGRLTQIAARAVADAPYFVQPLGGAPTPSEIVG